MAKLTVIEANDSITFVGLSGRLDVVGVRSVELEFTAKTASRRKPTILDLSELEFIASLGMGMLLRAAKSLQAHKAGMVILNPGELVERALTAVSIDRAIPIARDADQAFEILGVR